MIQKKPYSAMGYRNLVIVTIYLLQYMTGSLTMLLRAQGQEGGSTQSQAPTT